MGNPFKKNLRSGLFYAAVVASICFLMVFLIWNKYVKSLEENEQEQLQMQGDFIAQKIGRSIHTDIQSLENLKGRIEETNGEYFDYWEYDAQNILSQNPAYIFIEWIDSTMIIRKIEPKEGNEAALNLDISNIEYRREEWLRHAADSSTNVTPWSEMTQGGKAFLVDAPVYYDGRFQGTITAGLDFTQHFDRMLMGMEDYAVEIHDEEGSLFYSHNQPAESSLKEGQVFTHQYDVDPGDAQVWTLHLMPSSGAVSPRYNLEGLVWLVLGVLISLLLGVLTYYFLRLSQETKRIGEFNEKLVATNQALDIEREKEQKASRSKTDFISTMSHEIRTPLNAIIGLIYLLRESDLAAKEADLLDRMEFSSKNLLSLVNDILEVDKIESGKTVFKEEVFLPARELEKVVKVFRPEFERKGLFFNMEADGNDNYKVVGDPGKFNQIVTNLVRNAYKFTPSGGVVIRLKTSVEGKSARVNLEVSDSGIGIPEEKVKGIFDRFSQVDSGVGRKYEGTGLGLSITRQILDLMNGEISVESREGEGSTFKVHMQYPLAEPETAKETESDANHRIEFPGASVLIAEDNAMNVFILKQMLDTMEIKSTSVEDGKAAVECLKKEQFDLVLMDIHMPEVDGFTATRQIRKMNINTPVVALSANVTREAIEQANSVGMQDYVTKPFNRERLIEVFNKFL